MHGRSHTLASCGVTAAGRKVQSHFSVYALLSGPMHSHRGKAWTVKDPIPRETEWVHPMAVLGRQTHPHLSLVFFQEIVMNGTSYQPHGPLVASQGRAESNQLTRPPGRCLLNRSRADGGKEATTSVDRFRSI